MDTTITLSTVYETVDLTFIIEGQTKKRLWFLLHELKDSPNVTDASVI